MTLTMVDATARQLEAISAENERTVLLERATLFNFFRILGLAAGCWALFIFIGATYFREYGDRLGILNIPVILLYGASILGALWFTFIFCNEWLAIATLKTPAHHRAKVHCVGALILASLYTFVDHDPFSALRGTFVYFEHHGFFVLKLLVVGLLVTGVAYSFAKDAVLRDFPRYPLRWYALLSVSSLIIGTFWRPENDMSSAFHWYAQIAYYTGTVIVSFLSFLVGTRLGTHAISRENVT